ncbi:MAG: hypothetical protein NW224_00240 [Leptolyngbyaceae cyanobacterium bins.302]|nr:hypothetical protein [Leptolyngbyaceae cyanobacterium bins.302]
MTDLDRSIENLGDKIDSLAVQVGSLSETVTRLNQNLEQQPEHVAQLITLVQRQQATVDRLLSKLEGTP